MQLIDMRNVDAKDVALEIGVAPGSLNSILTVMLTFSYFSFFIFSFC